MTRVGDTEPIIRCIGQDFSRKCQWQIADFRPFESKLQRLFVQLARFAKVLRHPGDQLIELLVVAFPWCAANYFSRRIDQDTRANIAPRPPSADRVFRPASAWCASTAG